VAGLAITFGSGAMTNNIADFANAACIMAIGTNATHAHPIIGLEFKQAAHRGAKIIVVNPREIELCKFATLFLQLNPGTDVALINGIIKVILDEGLEDKAFIAERTENFAALQAAVQDYTLDKVEAITGVARDLIVKAARLYATTKPGSIAYTLGITEHSHGTDGVMSTANLAMLTGNIGKPGSGVNPLRGQNNVQGACDMGALPNVYPGYQAVDNPEVQAKFEAAWGVKLNPKVGLKLTELYQEAYEGRMKAFYLIGEDPALSEPDTHHVVAALKKLDFFVVQEIFLSETAKLADVVLPAASYAADDGTFTNTERRVQRVRKAVPPPGEAKPDWEAVCLVARKMGAQGFDYTHASQIWAEMASLTPSMAGISYARLEKGGLQWPCPTPDHPGTPILHTKIFTRGKGHFVPLSYRPDVEQPDHDYPLILITGRHLYHYHTGTMTHQVPGLMQLYPAERVEISPADAAALGIADKEMVNISSRRGCVTCRARVTTNSPRGSVYMNFHFTEVPTNVLTNNALDPISKTPEYKFCAVKVEKIKA
jgi:formate dehydrogenase alpha subunit